MVWNKNSDWLTVETAQAQVDFWQQDLKYAQEYLTYVKKFNGKKLKNFDKIFKVASDDVLLSKKKLELAKSKLKESIERDGLK